MEPSEIPAEAIASIARGENARKVRYVGQSPDVGALDVIIDDEDFVTWWRPNADEIRAIAAGAPIELRIAGLAPIGFAPVALGVVDGLPIPTVDENKRAREIVEQADRATLNALIARALAANRPAPGVANEESSRLTVADGRDVPRWRSDIMRQVDDAIRRRTRHDGAGV